MFSQGSWCLHWLETSWNHCTAVATLFSHCQQCWIEGEGVMGCCTPRRALYFLEAFFIILPIVWSSDVMGQSIHHDELLSFWFVVPILTLQDHSKTWKRPNAPQFGPNQAARSILYTLVWSWWEVCCWGGPLSGLKRVEVLCFMVKQVIFGSKRRELVSLSIGKVLEQ